MCWLICDTEHLFLPRASTLMEIFPWPDKHQGPVKRDANDKTVGSIAKRMGGILGFMADFREFFRMLTLIHGGLLTLSLS